MCSTHSQTHYHRLLGQRVSWCRSEHILLVFASHLFHTYVLPSVSWNAEFLWWVSSCCAASGWSDTTLEPLSFGVVPLHLAGLTQSGSSQVGCCPSSGAFLQCPWRLFSASSPFCLVARFRLRALGLLRAVFCAFLWRLSRRAPVACAPVVPLDECENGWLTQ